MTAIIITEDSSLSDHNTVTSGCCLRSAERGLRILYRLHAHWQNLVSLSTTLHISTLERGGLCAVVGFKEKENGENRLNPPQFKMEEEARHLLASSKGIMGEPSIQKALELMQTAIISSPFDPLTWQIYCDAQLLAGNVTEAMEYFASSLRLRSTSGQSRRR